ncbi:DEAD-box ATP-dependent RNA helicase 22-like, partial [Tasmannia lanceolata]
MLLHRPTSMLLYSRLSFVSSQSLSSSFSRFISPFKPFHSSASLFSSHSLGQNLLFYPKSLRFRINTRAFGTTVGSSLEEDEEKAKGKDTFFAEESVSWVSLGLSHQLSLSLSKAGLEKPSLVQAACIPSILSGVDVVIAAETGSGKTHGYLVPIVHKLRTVSSHPCTDDTNDDNQASPQPNRFISLVLCPNVMLCEQVVRMANCLRDVSSGEPLLRTHAVCGRQGWPVVQPDVIVSTPGALLNSIFAFDSEKRRADFVGGVKYVVFDEADMLLCGSFQNQVIRLINMLRFEEKRRSKMEGSVPENSMKFDVDSVVDFEPEDEEETEIGCVSEEEGAEGGVGPDELRMEEINVGPGLNDLRTEEINVGPGLDDLRTEQINVGPSKGTDWRRVRKVYLRSKQYIFVAATLPENGKKTAGGVLKRMFPDASWVSGKFLHRHSPRLEQRWIEVTTDTQVDALINAVKQGVKSEVFDSDDGVSRTMVFANTVDAVQSVVEILLRVGIDCISYHSDNSLEDRTKNLN